MAGTLSERLANGALVLSDTAQIKSQFPEWLRREIEDASHLMGEAAELARRVEGAPVATMDSRDALGICAPAEEDFPALYAMQGKRVALVEVGDV